MHCRACDRPLSDLEAVTKNLYGDYEELCQRCLDEDNSPSSPEVFELEPEELHSDHPDTLFKPLAEEADSGY